MDETLTKEDAQKLNEMVTVVTSQFQNLELKRSKMVELFENNGYNAAVTAISSPSFNETGLMSGKVSDALASVPAGSVLYKLASEKLTDLFLEYTNYPEAEKFVILIAPTAIDDSRKWWGTDAWLIEYFAPTQEAGTPRNDANRTIPYEPTRTDKEWNTTKSWSKKRYGFLFKIEQEPTHD